ncbi:DUF2645 family protein [Winslowiella iniecta]|uniref:DUF2645 family protein n=1 Tax=Winslowiella iniecta TaxID=1560201 RepID=UPI00092D5439|nr:DUF2645 family protein [Winslowiella iniecta]
MNWKKFTLSIISLLLCLFFIFYYSYFKEELYIDGDEIKNVCDARRVFVVDDIRDFTAPLSLLIISPFIFFSLKKSTRCGYLTLITLFLFCLWFWRFFGRFLWCS